MPPRARVDQQRIRAHEGQLGGADQVARRLGQWAMERQDIHLRQQLAEGHPAGGRITPRAGPLGDQHPHAEGLGSAGDPAAQLAVTDDAEPPSGELPDRSAEVTIQETEMLALRPVAAAYRGLLVREPGRPAEDDGQHMLHHRGGRVARDIGHRDPAVAGGLQVDVVGPGGGDTDQPQPGCRGHLIGAERHLVAHHQVRIRDARRGLAGSGRGVSGPAGADPIERAQVEVAAIDAAEVEDDPVPERASRRLGIHRPWSLGRGRVYANHVGSPCCLGFESLADRGFLATRHCEMHQGWTAATFAPVVSP